jgi:aminobenzoyl-glutamate utilization protein B
MHPRILAATAALFVLPVLADAQRPAPAKQAVAAEVDRLSGEIGRMSMTLWTYSETALKEAKSAAFLADLAGKEGFTVERGVAGMPTAFVATWGGRRSSASGWYDACLASATRLGPQPRADDPRQPGLRHNLFGPAGGRAMP